MVAGRRFLEQSSRQTLTGGMDHIRVDNSMDFRTITRTAPVDRRIRITKQRQSASILLPIPGTRVERTSICRTMASGRNILGFSALLASRRNAPSLEEKHRSTSCFTGPGEPPSSSGGVAERRSTTISTIPSRPSTSRPSTTILRSTIRTLKKTESLPPWSLRTRRPCKAGGISKIVAGPSVISTGQKLDGKTTSGNDRELVRSKRSELRSGPSARQLLQAIVDGKETSVAKANESTMRVMGERDGARLLEAILCTRSTATRRHARKAAELALAMPVCEAAGSDQPWEDLDAWLAAWMQARAGALPHSSVPAVAPQTAGKELGALIALIERIRDDWPTLSLALAARDACGTRDRCSPTSHRTAKGMIAPLVAHEFIEQSATTPRSLEQQERDAAIAVASAFSLPVGITRMLIPSEFRIVADKVASRPALILGFTPRE